MEGTRDGRPVDGCFYCELLFPGTAPCPLCKNRMRYASAEWGTARSRPERITELWSLYQATPDPRVLQELLTGVHAEAETPSEVEALGLDVEVLRREYLRFGDAPAE